MSKDQFTRRDFVRAGATAAVGVGVSLPGIRTVKAGDEETSQTGKILNHNSQMEYRRGGKTDLMFSVVCLGGHWKRVNAVVPNAFGGRSWLSASPNDNAFLKNRYDVVTRCIERGINYIDACCEPEMVAYSKAIKGRRDKMYLGCSWLPKESRSKDWRSAEKLKQAMDEGLKLTGLEYVDVWRITLHEQSSRHSGAEIEQAVEALDWAKKTGGPDSPASRATTGRTSNRSSRIIPIRSTSSVHPIRPRPSSPAPRSNRPRRETRHAWS